MPGGFNQYSTLTGSQKKVMGKMMKPINDKRFDFTRSPQYQEALAQLQGAQGDVQGVQGNIQGINQYAQGLMDPNSEAYQSFAAPEQRQFQEQTMPHIAEQFAGIGGLSSSGFQQAASQAGAGLAERLAALRSSMGMQGAQLGMQGAQLGLQGAGLQGQLAGQLSNMGAAPYDMLFNLAQLNQNRYSTALGTPTKAFAAKRPTFGQQFMGSLAGGLGKGIGGGIGGLFGMGGGGGGGGMGPGSQAPFMQTNNLGAMAAMA